MPALTAPVPIATPPSRNRTLPVAVDGVTAAVNVTACPRVDGLALAVSVSEEVALITWAIAGEVDPTVFESPPYEALRDCVPDAEKEVVKTATPETTEALPIGMPLFKNWMAPVAVDGLTPAVNVNACPAVAGLALDVSVTEEIAFTV